LSNFFGDFAMRKLLLGALLAALTACAQVPNAPPADMGPWSAFHPSEVAIGGG
jgi:hypothetical protein